MNPNQGQYINNQAPQYYQQQYHQSSGQEGQHSQPQPQQNYYQYLERQQSQPYTQINQQQQQYPLPQNAQVPATPNQIPPTQGQQMYPQMYNRNQQMGEIPAQPYRVQGGGTVVQQYPAIPNQNQVGQQVIMNNIPQYQNNPQQQIPQQAIQHNKMANSMPNHLGQNQMQQQQQQPLPLQQPQVPLHQHLPLHQQQQQQQQHPPIPIIQNQQPPNQNSVQSNIVDQSAQLLKQQQTNKAVKVSQYPTLNQVQQQHILPSQQSQQNQMLNLPHPQQQQQLQLQKQNSNIMQNPSQAVPSITQQPLVQQNNQVKQQISQIQQGQPLQQQQIQQKQNQGQFNQQGMPLQNMPQQIPPTQLQKPVQQSIQTNYQQPHSAIQLTNQQQLQLQQQKQPTQQVQQKQLIQPAQQKIIIQQKKMIDGQQEKNIQPQEINIQQQSQQKIPNHQIQMQQPPSQQQSQAIQHKKSNPQLQQNKVQQQFQMSSQEHQKMKVNNQPLPHIQQPQQIIQQKPLQLQQPFSSNQLQTQQNYQQQLQQQQQKQQQQSQQLSQQQQSQQMQQKQQNQQQWNQQNQQATSRQQRLDSGENQFQYNPQRSNQSQQQILGNVREQEKNQQKNFKKGQYFDIKQFDSVLDNRTVPKLFNLTKDKVDEINSILPAGYQLDIFNIYELKFNPVIYGESANDFGETPQKKLKTEDNSYLQFSISQLPQNAPMKRELIQLMNIKPSTATTTPIKKAPPSYQNSQIGQSTSHNSTPQKSLTDISSSKPPSVQQSQLKQTSSTIPQSQQAMKEQNIVGQEPKLFSQNSQKHPNQTNPQQNAMKQAIQQQQGQSKPNQQVRLPNQGQKSQSQIQQGSNKISPLSSHTGQQQLVPRQQTTPQQSTQQRNPITTAVNTLNAQIPSQPISLQQSQLQQKSDLTKSPLNQQNSSIAQNVKIEQQQQENQEGQNIVQKQVHPSAQHQNKLHNAGQNQQQNIAQGQAAPFLNKAQQQKQPNNSNTNLQQNQNSINLSQKMNPLPSSTQNQANIDSKQNPLKLQVPQSQQPPQQQSNTTQQQSSITQQTNLPVQTIQRQPSQQKIAQTVVQGQGINQIGQVNQSQPVKASNQQNSAKTQPQMIESSGGSISIKLQMPLQEQGQPQLTIPSNQNQNQAEPLVKIEMPRNNSSQNISTKNESLSILIQSTNSDNSEKVTTPIITTTQFINQQPIQEINKNTTQSVNVPKKTDLPLTLQNNEKNNQPNTAMNKQSAPMLSSLPPSMRQQIDQNNQNKNINQVEQNKNKDISQISDDFKKDIKMEVEESGQKSIKISLLMPQQQPQILVKQEEVNELPKKQDNQIKQEPINQPNQLQTPQPVAHRPRSIDFPRPQLPNSQILNQVTISSHSQNIQEAAIKADDTKIVIKMPDMRQAPSPSAISPKNSSFAQSPMPSSGSNSFIIKLPIKREEEQSQQPQDSHLMDIEQPMDYYQPEVPQLDNNNQNSFSHQEQQHSPNKMSKETPYFQTKIEPAEMMQSQQNVKIEPFSGVQQLQSQPAMVINQIEQVEQVQKGNSENSLVLIMPHNNNHNQPQMKIEADSNVITLPAAPQMMQQNSMNQEVQSNKVVEFKKKKMEKKNITQEDQKIMTDIIYRLMKNKNSDPFKKLSGLSKNADYMRVIKEPMDLQTVETNIKKKYYSNIDEMAIDVQKIFINAKLYNKEDTEIYKKAIELEEYFKKKYQKSPLSNEINNLQKKVDKLGKELKEFHTYGGRFFYRENKKIQKQAFMERSMTLDEKTQLAKNIRKLPKEYWVGIWEIMTDKQFCIADKQRIEFDLDTTTPKQCRRLERYVKAKLASIQKAREKRNKKLDKQQNKPPSEYLDQAKIDKLDTDSSYITDSDDSMKDPDEDGGEM